MTKGWYGNRMSHSLASKGIKTSIVTTKFPKIENPREREYIFGHASYISFLKKNFVNFLEELFWNWEDTGDYFSYLYKKYNARWIDNRDETMCYRDIEDRSDVGIFLHGMYIDLKMVDEAKIVRRELKEMGLNVDILKKNEERISR